MKKGGLDRVCTFYYCPGCVCRQVPQLSRDYFARRPRLEKGGRRARLAVLARPRACPWRAGQSTMWRGITRCVCAWCVSPTWMLAFRTTGRLPVPRVCVCVGMRVFCTPALSYPCV